MKRDPYFDNIKFLLILLVIINHTIGPHHPQNGYVLMPLHMWLASFHMPLFIFVAGYFANPDKSRSVILSRYLLPYLIFNPLYYLAIVPNSNNYLYPASALWFLLAILFYHLLLPLVAKHLKSTIIVSVALALVAWNFNPARHLLGIPHVIAFMPYFFIGYLAKVKHVSFNVSFRVKYLAYCVLALMLISCCCNTRAIYDIVWLRSETISFQYMLIVMAMSLAFLCAVPKTKTFYTRFGQNTIYAYLLHSFIIYHFHVSNPLLLLALSALVTLVLSSDVVKAIAWPFVESHRIITILLSALSRSPSL